MLKIKKYLFGGQEGSLDMSGKVAAAALIPTKTPWMLKNQQGIMMGLQVANSMLGTPKDYNGAAGGKAMAIDGFTDAASQVASQFGPVGLYIGMGLQANKLLSNLTQKITGIDGMTSTDIIMNRVPVLGLVNGLGGKRADTMQQDVYTQSLSLYGYGGTNMDINNAAAKSGKKYGMFSSKARKHANDEIMAANRKLTNLKYLIKDRDTAMDYMSGSVDLYNTGYTNDLIGGIEPMIAAKKGGKLTGKNILKAKRVTSKHKFTKKLLKAAADALDDLDAYKQGGSFEFDISMFLKGGKNLPYKEWIKGVNPEYLSDNYDLESAYKYLPERELEMWKYATNHPDRMNFVDKNGFYPYHLSSIVQLPNLDYMFLKLGKEDTNKELLPELEEYNSGKNGLKETHDLVFDNGRYWYKKRIELKPLEEKTSSTRVEPIIESHKEGGKSKNLQEMEIPDFLTLDLDGNYVSKYYLDDDLAEDLTWKQPKEFKKLYKLWEEDGGKFKYVPKKKWNDLWYEKNKKYILLLALISPFEQLYDYETLDGNIAKPTGEYDENGKELYETPDGLLYTMYKEGGSIIPEGALHKNLNHLEEVNPDLKGEVTKKGIPIISEEDGGEIVLHAEIEEGEIIFQKSVTEKLEELYKEYNKEDTSQSKKDELAIKAGKIIAKEIMEKTDDKVGLIEKTE